mmetsp:Transcript_108363/g.312199  ORF Transcript_108363/g.312199 Transcript_108363/m.312199 type:complete len:249 (-) Transcript_108363:146-892(-)
MAQRCLARGGLEEQALVALNRPARGAAGSQDGGQHEQEGGLPAEAPAGQECEGHGGVGHERQGLDAREPNPAQRQQRVHDHLEPFEEEKQAHVHDHTAEARGEQLLRSVEAEAPALGEERGVLDNGRSQQRAGARRHGELQRSPPDHTAPIEKSHGQHDAEGKHPAEQVASATNEDRVLVVLEHAGTSQPPLLGLNSGGGAQRDKAHGATDDKTAPQPGPARFHKALLKRGIEEAKGQRVRCLLAEGI